MSVQRPRGTADILPGEVEGWQRLETTVRNVYENAAYGEIRTPIFEHTELFERGVGDTTDIVEKEMYTFRDRADRSITLRPEGTASVTRAFVENKLYGNPGTTKLYYMGPMFRYEKPQKGRMRQLHQYGCEVLGADGPAIDAEVIALSRQILEDFGLERLTVELNSVGCKVCRPLHKEKMVAALQPFRQELCTDCQGRLERNPLRIFDCKSDRCQAILKESGAPKVIEVLCDDCQTHFDGLQTFLQQMEVPYVINDMLVRGLDYYTRTAWEITSPGYSTIAGGGRYNGLVADLGGPETPGIGFAGGMERALLVLAEQKGSALTTARQSVYVAVADASAEVMAMRLLLQLRSHGVVADRDYQGKSMKAQFKAADRVGARYCIVLGETEVQTGMATVKDLSTGEQRSVALSEVAAVLSEQI